MKIRHLILSDRGDTVDFDLSQPGYDKVSRNCGKRGPNHGANNLDHSGDFGGWPNVTLRGARG